MKVLLLSLLFMTGISLSARESIPMAEKGVLDLRNVEHPEKLMVKLNGEWEFYWKKMLRPHDFGSGLQQAKFGKVPSYWTDYPDEYGTTGSGYATYRLKILLPANCPGQLGIDLPVFDSSYDIYIDGRYLGGNGIPGRTPAETKPGYSRNFFRVVPQSNEMTIIINIANFSHRRGGFWLPVRFGSFDNVRERMARIWAAEWSVVSILAGFSIFFLFFFIISPKEKIMGYFGLLTFGLALRPFFTNQFLINNFFNVSWEWIVRLEYLGLFLTIIAVSWFACNLYSYRFIRITARIFSAVFSAAALVVLLTPVKSFSYLIIIFYPSMLLIMSYLLFGSIKGALKKNRIDIVYMLAFLILLAGGLHDINVSLGKSNSSSGYILTYLIVVFLFIQASLLLYKWVKAFQEKEKLQAELEFMNHNLEQLVSIRTHELQKRNEEIEQQSNHIAEKNRQLSETIQLKNKIFSVIAHDLRSPVVNILYMLNLLKEKEFKEKYDTFASSCIQYSQRVINLLENMLVWGRGQEEKIKFSPEHHDLSDIILTNLSIFKETADNKEISVNFTQVGSSVAYCDRDLMDIIIRNLLSNAVKYTPRKGRISIFLKDKKKSEGVIMLRVCDNGIGIPPHLQKTLFTSENMESTPGTENEKGTGFGLKLCHELVRISNGTIEVESRINEGTCFIITLPA